MTEKINFNYDEAFRRSRGFISEEEQSRLKSSRVAVAGLGGAGGAQVLALARAGVGCFTLADLDIFETSNINRQFGAMVSTLGKSKTEVMRDQILDINPEAKITLINQGISSSTIDDFLKDVDVVMDALDFNCFKERFLLYKKVRQKNLWSITVAPAGFGASLLIFDPQGMPFSDYFDIHEDMTSRELSFSFVCGLTPAAFVLKYIDRQVIDLDKGALSCVSPGFFITAGVAVTEALNILLRKRAPKAVPWVFQFDALLHCYKKSYYPMGMRSPWQRIKKKIILKFLEMSK